jgi:hypothetical protein
LLAVVLIGGGILLFFLLQPRSNNTTNTTTNPTSIPNRTSVAQPTQGAQPTQDTPSTGGAGEAVSSFYNSLRTGNYSAAFDLLTPDAQSQFGDVAGLESQWQDEVNLRGGNLQSVSIDDVSDQGGSAFVSVTLTYEGGETSQIQHEVQQSGNRWLINN